MESNENNKFPTTNNIIFNTNDLEEISIKVKTIDSNEYLVLTNKDSRILELKQKIEEVKKINLIF